MASNCKPTSFKIFPTSLAPMRITPPFEVAMQFNSFSRFAKSSVGIPKSALKTGFRLTTGTPFVKTWEQQTHEGFEKLLLNSRELIKSSHGWFPRKLSS